MLDDGTADLSLIFFGQQFLIRQIKEGQQIVVSGQTSVYGKRLQMSSPEWEHLDGDNLHTIGIVPVYRLTKGLNPRRFRKLMRDAVQYWSEKLPDYVPEATLDRGELADLGWALRNVHFPESHDHLMHARRRLVFDELLLMQLAILGNRREWQSVPAQALEVADEFLDKFIEAAFPYDLTGAQQRAVDDIRRDVGLDVPMNRLIQGDVGSGKTAVATIALAMAFANGKQAALMAPTGILAEQHYRGVSETLEAMPGSIKPVVALLTGAIAKAERERVYAGLADGTIDVVIGTHAVIQEGVEFADLGLAIIDEQHRFGVEQRGTLRGKGENPHLLVMTATPIPRTLALTLYADLDLSVIDEMPPGRTPTKTRIRQPVEREQVYDFIEAQMEKGRQAFIVHPLVEASETIEAEAALDAFERLKDVFHRYNVGLLHGRMKPAEKDEAMYAFGEGYYDILVTTSVAEVGVNVPNASVMMIEGANRFGLSQLHQFRGRVGRGQHPGYCLLIPDKKFNDAEVQMLTSEGILNPTDDTDVDEALAKLEALTGHIDVSLQRLAAMELTSDGFKLAEIDWRLRGAGDLLGVSQSGGNKLQLMETMDPEMVSLSQREAKTIYADDLWLEAEEHALLRQRVQQIIDARSDVS